MAPPESALKAVGLQQNGLFLAVSLAAAFGVSGTPTRPCGRGWVGAAVAASRDSGTLQSVWTAGGRWYRSWKVVACSTQAQPRSAGDRARSFPNEAVGGCRVWASRLLWRARAGRRGSGDRTGWRRTRREA
ncbi:hypothetical protein BGZ61DRAFT_448186 [Ilyonectria robusta]|uniref:uncharacterized protein n=1 Tax=Ilyonectria robusta TaxID=1079257 RepID=UPI001E8EE5BF|nr:uncharacterized protein BGZ61DRAFT_448186 [Ilyonectria robusta]KAH8722193.1 hypothetical protein BGZ61DRAFT_448186 [Ilyonectria robusta]